MCPGVCPHEARNRSTPTQRQPRSQNKNGPEIMDFRPVLQLLAALANRRLQPLGHLTARGILSINNIASYGKAIVPTSVPEIVPGIRPEGPSLPTHHREAADQET